MSTISVAAPRKTRLPRAFRTIAVTLVVLYGLACAGFYYAMSQPPAVFGNVMKHTGPAPFLLFPFEMMWKSARAGHVSAGDAAPDFTLPLLDHSGTVTLSSNHGLRPVVLIFGSYT